MSTEMGATRLLAPYFGTSLLIWANLIGLVLLYLTLGYVIGGRLADRFPTRSAMYQVTAWAGFLVVLVPILSRPLLLWSVEGFTRFSTSIFFGSLFAIIALLGPPLILLGCVSPWATRLQVESVAKAGNAAGSVYALSTVGSLTGTFASVLLLQPEIGTRASIWIFGIGLLSLSLAGLAPALGRRALPYAAMLGLALALVVIFNGGGVRSAAAGELLMEDESAYNYIQVVRNEAGWTDLILNEGQAVHSKYHPTKLLTGGPWDYFLLAPLFRPEGLATPVEDVAVVGLAAGTMPRMYEEVYPEAEVDGVEIDGRIVEVGREYFDMNGSNLNAIVADGRQFLRATDKQYDVIGIDAYRQPYIPFHLATQEFFETTRERLKPGGVVVINAGGTPGDYRLVEAMGNTMGAVFPSVFMVTTENRYNTLVFATEAPMTLARFRENAMQVDDPILQTVISAAWEVGNVRVYEPDPSAAFTDDLAPIEQVIDQIIVDYALDQTRQ